MKTTFVSLALVAVAGMMTTGNARLLRADADEKNMIGMQPPTTTTPPAGHAAHPPAAAAAAAPATPAAPAAPADAAPGPVEIKRIPSSAKCADSLGDVDFKVLGESAWSAEGKDYVQTSFLISNSGTKDVCGVELFTPTNMTVWSSYSVTLDEGTTGYKATFPEWLNKLGPGQANALGFILEGDNATLGETCVTAVKEC